MIVSKFSLDYERQTMKEVNEIRTEHFWSKHLLTYKEKRRFNCAVRLHNFLQFVLWCLALIDIIMLNAMSNVYPFFIYEENWSLCKKIIAIMFIYIAISFGYYIGNTHECYFAYHILQTYFQMDILLSYIRKSLRRYKKLNFTKKMNSETYQAEAKRILKTSIAHYNYLKTCLNTIHFYYKRLIAFLFRYGIKITKMYSSISVWHFFVGIFVISVGLHSILFVSTFF